MNVIQSAAAVYVLVCVATLVFIVLRAAWTNKPWNGTANWPVVSVALLAAVICAITTIGSL